MSAEIQKRGPFFRGMAAPTFAQMSHQAKEAVSDRTLTEVHARLGTVLKHPTGRYESNIVVDRASTSNQVSDGGIVYGPWLEGVSSRNQSTRFKGYKTFRLVTQAMKPQAEAITQAIVGRLLGRLK